ncbi:glycosyltransferase family 2 protein [Candidatus Bathyarchaeota archaeon]|nr:glycosyltransferase family 2 protein [Candidatus Bathyarchaeota archaeon]
MVSIVIPAYNAENFIECALKSCLTQTYRPMEIIVVNDGSTDSTARLVKNFSEVTSDNGLEIKVLEVGENKGAANALNVGFSNAKGFYICWLSADDAFIDKRKIEKQVDFMEKTSASWSYFQDFYQGTDLSKAVLMKCSYLRYLRILDPVFIQNSDLRLMMLMFQNPINGSSIMVKKDCVNRYGNFDPVLRNVDGDGDLWMRYSVLKLKLALLKGATVFYRVHSAQTSQKKTVMMHGCELTRMRILLTLERMSSLTSMIKQFTPFFLVILLTKQYLARSFVSEFLFDHILNHKNEFNPVFLHYVQKSLNIVRKHANYRVLNKDKFLSDLKVLKESYTFKKFEEILTSQNNCVIIK